ncbi:MAG: gliding motility protein GldL [Dysgonamonadaceae bacterium]|jgi:hypothetical protein|nr:gliding motility protein GldL [Dysgonamonadaceae bacterium]
MGFKRRYKNIVEKFLSEDRGKRFFQYFYNWGAAVVIIGALAKLTHLPYGNTLLTIGLLTEFFVFFISAFDRPGKDYKWEDVFPVLDSKNPDDRPAFNSGGGTSMIVGNGNGTGNVPVSDVGNVAGGISGPIIIGGSGGYAGGGFMGGGSYPDNANLPAGENDGEVPLTSGQVKKSFGIPNNVEISEENTNALTASIQKLSDAAGQLAKMAELTDATQQYLEQIAKTSENIQRFNDVTNNLADVSDVLLTSYKSITDNSDDISENAKGYVVQMDTLNQNVANLNRIFEMQLHGVNSQMEAVNRINAGLSRIKEMYESSVVDSSVFRSETEKMTQQIAALNNVYTRLLNAMTMNMNVGYNPGYPNPSYNPAYNHPNPGYTPPQSGGYRPDVNNANNGSNS